MKAEGLAATTIRDRPRAVRQAARDTGLRPHELTSDAIEAWVGMHHAPATRATYFRALRAWHRWLQRTGRRPDDPMALLRAPRVPRSQPRPITTAQLRRILVGSMRESTRAAILLAAYQGLRVHEVAKLRGEDVDVVAGTLRVLGKGGVEATVPLHPVVIELARSMPRRGWWFPSATARLRGHVAPETMTTTISRAMKRAGVDATAHQLRHWYATELLRSGADVRIVQTLMRHASLATTAIYTRVDEDQQRLAALGLPDAADIAA